MNDVYLSTCFGPSNHAKIHRDLEIGTHIGDFCMYSWLPCLYIFLLNIFKIHGRRADGIVGDIRSNSSEFRPPVSALLTKRKTLQTWNFGTYTSSSRPYLKKTFFSFFENVTMAVGTLKKLPSHVDFPHPWLPFLSKSVITIYIADVKLLYIQRKFEIFCEHDRRTASIGEYSLCYAIFECFIRYPSLLHFVEYFCPCF